MPDTILFDLDGTLLPFEQEDFIREYFADLCAGFPQYAPEKFVDAVWAGTAAMIRNDGQEYNRDVFWRNFAGALGDGVYALEDTIDDFYGGPKFDGISRVLKTRRDLRPMIAGLKNKGYTLVLATNPIFPLVAVRTRLGWIGLEESDFSLITMYSNSKSCKPNLSYYKDILAKTGKAAEQCVMVGNSVLEDMCAEKLGIKTILITDHIENAHVTEFTRFERMSFNEFAEYAAGLKPVIS